MHGKTEEEDHQQRIRFRLYWMTCVLSMLVFLLMMYWAAMLQFPRGQFPPMLGLAMCSILCVVSGVPLLIGFGRFKTGHAPVARRPLGTLLIVPILLELGLSVIGICQMIGRLLLKP